MGETVKLQSSPGSCSDSHYTAAPQAEVAKQVNPLAGYEQSTIQSYQIDFSLTSDPIEQKKQQGVIGSLLTWFQSLYKETPAPAETPAENIAAAAAQIRPVLTPPAAVNAEKVLQEMKAINQVMQDIQEQFDQPGDQKNSQAIILKLFVTLFQEQIKIRQTMLKNSQDKLMEEQESIEQLHQKRMANHEKYRDLAKVDKKLSIASTSIDVAGTVAVGLTFVLGAATIASGGILSPLLFIPGATVGLARAVTTAIRGKNTHDMEKNQAESMEINEKKEVVTIKLEATLGEFTSAMKKIGVDWQTLGKILRNQQEATAAIR